MKRRNLCFAGLMVAVGLLAGCSDWREPAAPVATIAPRADAVRYVPTPLQPVTLDGRELHVWPYTGAAFPATPIDPINLVFVGDYADPRQIRAALLGLGGSYRGDMGLGPGVLPYDGVFNCAWTDGIGGDNQTAFVQEAGWTGSVIQLVCGPYNVFRFHLRLFPFGPGLTLGGAHFEMNIPGTADHESLSWEIARAVVVHDLVLAGRATVLGNATMGSSSPYYRTVRDQIYPAVAGLMSYLEFLTTGTWGSSSNINNSGEATVLQLSEPPAVQPGSGTATLTINYFIDIPQPFCSPGEFLHVQGPIQLSQTTTLTASGDYSATFTGKGVLDATALIGGQSFQADIDQVNASLFSDEVPQVSLKAVQRMIPPVPGRGFEIKSLLVGPGATTAYQDQVHCYE